MTLHLFIVLTAFLLFYRLKTFVYIGHFYTKVKKDTKIMCHNMCESVLTAIFIHRPTAIF